MSTVHIIFINNNNNNKGGRGLRIIETEYREKKMKAGVNLYHKKDPAMKMVWDFEERAESVGRQRITKELSGGVREGV